MHARGRRSGACLSGLSQLPLYFRESAHGYGRRNSGRWKLRSVLPSTPGAGTRQGDGEGGAAHEPLGGLCMEADFLFTCTGQRAAGWGHGARERGRASAGTAQPGWSRPSVRPSVPLALPGDVMLERKHSRSLNASSPLQRSDAGADGCGTGSFAEVPAASGL